MISLSIDRQHSFAAQRWLNNQLVMHKKKFLEEKKLLNSFLRIALILGDSVLAYLFTVDEDLKKKFQDDFDYDHD